MTQTVETSAVPSTYQDEVDELRCHDNHWLRSERSRVVVEQRRLKVREVAITRVLDERDALDPVPDATVSARSAKATIDVARALDSVPAIAEAARDGELSFEQLEQVVRLATPESDQEWARRAKNTPPGDLARLVRQRKRVTARDAEARYQARELRTWREADFGMFAGRYRLPDLDGILVDKVLDHMAERMRPAQGEPWDSLEHRKADALVELCRTYADVETTGRFKFTIVTHRRADGTADCDGIQLAPETVDAISPNAMVKERTDDSIGMELEATRARAALPAPVERYVTDRDPHCRVAGCTNTRGLQIHHLIPCCKGGIDAIDNLARVCPYHHHMLTPHGPWHLLGDPNQIDGLRLVHKDELTEARAGPAP